MAAVYVDRVVGVVDSHAIGYAADDDDSVVA